MVLSTAERPHASAFAAALLPPLEGHPSMEDVFSPADLIGPRPQLSFTGQHRRPSTDQQRLPPPGSRGRCGRRHLYCVGRAEPASWSEVSLSC